MVTFRTEDFWESKGNAAFQWSEDVRDGVLNFACQLWEDYPKWVLIENPLNSFVRGYLNASCAARGNLPAAPESPFVGGQCDTDYHVVGTYQNANTGASWACEELLVFDTRLNGAIVRGRVVGLGTRPFGAGEVLTIRYIDKNTGLAQETTPGGNISGNFVNTEEQCSNITADTQQNYMIAGSGKITQIIRIDGLPDDCPSLPPEYPDVTPTSQDLSTTIIINNNDGLSTTHNLVYNQITANYNFPMGFKLDGVNITFDIEGITIHGAPQITSPNSDNETPPPPGTDGGTDGVGGNNDTVYPEQQYPKLPELVTPETVLTPIQYILCTEGALETVNLIIKQSTSINPLVTEILNILINIVQEICEAGEAEGLVGIPEYYGIRPGAERPAIVYLWKEVVGSTIQASTYSSTVQNPSAAAISAIDTVVVPDKTIGTYMTSVTLTDGSRIRATGNTISNADTNFFFLLDQVDAAFKQSDINDRITRSENTRLEVKTLKCRQIEYYPNGKDANTAPSTRRVIDIT